MSEYKSKYTGQEVEDRLDAVDVLTEQIGQANKEISASQLAIEQLASQSDKLQSAIGSGAKIGANSTIGVNAIVGPSAVLGSSANVAPYAKIGASVNIEQGTTIGRSVSIADGANIGDALIGSGVEIGDNVYIGQNIHINSQFNSLALGNNVQTITIQGGKINLNDYSEKGTYRISGEVTYGSEVTNLPMQNHGGGNTIDAMLWVLDSSLPNIGAKDDDVCITQFLLLSNRTGGAEGDMFMRSANGKTKDSLTWKAWEKYQTNVEVGMVTSLDEFVDNGIYSGIYNTGGRPSEIETFVMIVINNYVVANTNKTITQIKYSTRVDGVFATQTRSKGVATGGVWSDWQRLGINSISFDEHYDSAIQPRCFTTTVVDEEGNIEIVPIFANLDGRYEGLVKADDVRKYVANQIKQAITDTLNKEV